MNLVRKLILFQKKNWLQGKYYCFIESTMANENRYNSKHRMRDQMSTDAEHRAHGSSMMNESSSGGGRKPATLESVATISYKSARPESSTTTTVTTKPASVGGDQDDDNRPALPATASWAKAGGSGPSTPVMKSGGLPERSLTPDNFGPPLAVAVAAAAAQKQQQQQQQASAAAKRKIEKKKRKEQMKSESSSNGSRPATPSTLPEQNDVTVIGNGDSMVNGNSPFYLDGLIGFVLGDALNEVCSLSRTTDQEDMPVGVSALHDDNEEDDNEPNTTTKDIQDNEDSNNDEDAGISALEFLTNATPTHSYTGTFNPFTHQILRSTGSLFETPMRKCSRFGFAQI